MPQVNLSSCSSKINKVAFRSYLHRKNSELVKLDQISYQKLEIQPYLESKVFGKKETKLMSLLRSKCHQAKSNFRKMNKNNTKCSLGCNKIETQYHIFEECQPIHTQVIL